MGLKIPILGTIIPNMGAHNLSDALFSKVQQRVLGLLFGQPDRCFYTNEIIRLTQSGTGAVQRELAKLSASALVTTNIVGNQKQYQANRHSPLFNELRSIILKTCGLTDVIKESLKSLIPDITVAFVYGSIAKNEDTSSSDIDLMILSDTISYSEVFLQLQKAEKVLHRHVNPTCYSISEWIQKRKKKNNFITQTIKQPKIFVVGSEIELNELK